MAKMAKHSFHNELVLNRYLLRLFNCDSLHAMKDRLGEDRHEGIVEGQSSFFHALQHSLFQTDCISPQDLRRYDLNVVQHWNAITGQRNKQEGTVLNMKYFQYLSLLFTEIYLDRYFNQRQKLLNDLNESVQVYNRVQPADQQLQPYEADELNKLAFWNATGSGKTLLLHVNILQYLHYFQHGNANVYPDKIILLTPNEGLSRQHLDELALSGIGLCRLFDKNTGNVLKGTVEVIDINKLDDDMGDKTVAVEAFEGNNLVLVDEGHKGIKKAGEWMSRREALVRGGFAFEYSATFGQAVSKGLTVIKAEREFAKKKARKLFETANLSRLDDTQRRQLMLTSEEKRKVRTMATRESYAKSILFDYSYKFFYEDGYGKESLILNLKDQDYRDDNIARQYFTACLLSFYQQQYLWQTHQARLEEFNIEKPLWVFVGNTVSGEDSDILSVLRFLAQFLNDEIQTRQWLADLLANTARLLDTKGNNIFHDRFAPLMSFTADQIYSGILKLLFNTDSRQRLKVVNLKRSKGELVLRVGEADPFGLINIGDDAGFFKAAESEQYIKLFDTTADDFGETLFDTINGKDSKLHMLIGSRKFTEGWSSWRVSTMGLLNMGKGEGSQIIQLFGRGVRLKGIDYSLKRSIPGQRPKGVHLDRLETLNIFGVNAGYMAAFKDYLREEGITPTDEIIELNFETRINLPKENLKTLTLKDGYKDNQIKGFKRVHFPWLFEVPDEYAGRINLPEIELDLYPKIEALSAGKQQENIKLVNQVRQKGKISGHTMALFDFDRIYLALQEYKQLRSWSNLRLTRSRLKDFCLEDDDWYTLYIPPTELVIHTIADIRKQEDILIRLLQDYTDRFYKTLKTAYESRFYEIDYIKNGGKDEDKGPLLKSYHFSIDPTDNGKLYGEEIKKLQPYVEKGEIEEASKWSVGQMEAICYESHLYYPLFSTKDGTSLNSGIVPLKIRPLAFDSPSEDKFVRNLEAFCQSSPGKQIIGKRSLYLLRNADNKARGLGFALAGNFYPDFLLWLVDNETGNQWLNFVDPKGLRQMNLADPKLQLYQEVKDIQQKLADPKLTLNAFIISATRFTNLLNVSCDQSELEARNVLFMDDGGSVYLKKMFERMKLQN